MRLANKVAIVTGGAGGMGEASALLFAREGASVAVVDLQEDGAEVTAGAINAAGGRAIAISADVAAAEQVQHVVDRTIAELGLPTVLFNNAGVHGEMKHLVDFSEEEFARTLQVNVKGVWLGMKYAIPAMIEAGGGTIVNTASVSAFKAGSAAVYAASKTAVVAMTRVAANEFGRDHIRVNALCPGATLTPMTRRAQEEQKARGIPHDAEVVKSMSLFGRMADPEEMASVALFLASDESSFATGMYFLNDGGWATMGGRSYR
jgi:NAD(P)-dependent dehydrogenase (short-subunit alcohol dehydrogenase family)